MELAILLEAVNLVLLSVLLYVYVGNYRTIRTGFGLGLVVFAAMLAVQNALALYFHVMMVDYYSAAVMGHALWLDAAQSAALLVLAWKTWTE
ncbi:hypothetical protein HY994_05890 [Candidatus Micrarchaeota archaeon]|nr:hypothetical protein [Candidatus Micrarchaeota archaeon]